MILVYLRSIELMKDRFETTKCYPFNLPLATKLDTLDITHSVTMFVGENGSGKSTLLEAIAYQCGFHTAGGGRNNTYEATSSEAALGDYIRLSWLPKMTNGFFLRAESFYLFASHIDQIGGQGPYGSRSLHAQSHGESFLSLFVNRFNRKGIYLLDEPEAALSPSRQLALLRIIKDLSTHSQFIIATHSPILLGYPDAQIINFDSDTLAPIAYEDTDHYQLTRRFLENRARVLEQLFAD
jgi:predicted ATPase